MIPCSTVARASKSPKNDGLDKLADPVADELRRRVEEPLAGPRDVGEKRAQGEGLGEDLQRKAPNLSTRLEADDTGEPVSHWSIIEKQWGEAHALSGSRRGGG